MCFINALIILSVFLMSFLIPEISIASGCSANAGKMYGCRSGIACPVKSTRPGGSITYVCQEGPSLSGATSNPNLPAQVFVVSGKKLTKGTKGTKKNPPEKTDSGSPLSGACNEDGSNEGCQAQAIPEPEQRGTGPALSSEPLTDEELCNLDPTKCKYTPVMPGQEQQQAQVYSGNCNCPSGSRCERAEASQINSLSQQYEIIEAGTFAPGNGITPFGRACLRPKGQAAAAAQPDESGACMQQFQQLRAACEAEADRAGKDCNEENETIQAAMEATKVVGAGAGVSMQLACSKLGKISKIANGAAAAWQTGCAATQTKCSSSCSDARRVFAQQGCFPTELIKEQHREQFVEVTRNINTCESYKQKIAQAAQHAMAALMQLQAAKQCQDDVGNGLVNTDLNKCKDDPNNPACSDQQKCSNAAYAATNAVCKCFNSATANSKECLAATGAMGNRGLAGGGLSLPGGRSGPDAGSSMLPGAGATPGATPGADPFGSPLGDNSGKGDGQNLSGQKGNAGLGSGSGSSGGNAGGAGAPGAPGAGGDPTERTKVNSGFYGGATAGSSYFGANSGAGAYGLVGRTNTGGVNYDKVGGAQFDPRRYIAGLNGKGGEFINGPGIDIFKIVKNRIEAKKPSLLDPDFKK